MTLAELGLQHYLNQTKLKLVPQQLARIVAEHKTGWTMVNQTGELRGLIMTSFRNQHPADQLPKVGDFVEYDLIPQENKAKITSVLGRYSTLLRRQEGKTKPQILACNVDALILISGLDQDFRLEQLRRYVAMAAAAKIAFALVINKTDLGAGVEARQLQIKRLFPQIKILQTSTKTKIGLDALQRLLSRGQTVVLLGSSGAGKSSLINALAEQSSQATKTVRSDGKGRHTTTRREMFLLPNGAIVIDTPGIRTLAIDVTTDELSLDELLPELIKQCRFRDCDHYKSAGCAVLSAVKTKQLSEQQYQNFLKQLRDAERSETNSSSHGRKNSKAKFKTMSKAIRQAYNTRKPPKK